MADLRVFFEILNGKVRPEANWVGDLGCIDDRPDAQTPKCMSARRSVLHQLDGMTLAEIGAMTQADFEELVRAERRRRGWMASFLF
jgi:hypothetical protein